MRFLFSYNQATITAAFEESVMKNKAIGSRFLDKESEPMAYSVIAET